MGFVSTFCNSTKDSKCCILTAYTMFRFDFKSRKTMMKTTMILGMAADAMTDAFGPAAIENPTAMQRMTVGFWRNREKTYFVSSSARASSSERLASFRADLMWTTFSTIVTFLQLSNRPRITLAAVSAQEPFSIRAIRRF